MTSKLEQPGPARTKPWLNLSGMHSWLRHLIVHQRFDDRQKTQYLKKQLVIIGELTC